MVPAPPEVLPGATAQPPPAAEVERSTDPLPDVAGAATPTGSTMTPLATPSPSPAPPSVSVKVTVPPCIAALPTAWNPGEGAC